MRRRLVRNARQAFRPRTQSDRSFSYLELTDSALIQAFPLQPDPIITAAMVHAVEISIILNYHLSIACIKIGTEPPMYLGEDNIKNLLVTISNINNFALTKLRISSKRMKHATVPKCRTDESIKIFVRCITDVLTVLLLRSNVTTIYLEPTTLNINEMIRSMIGTDVVDKMYICQNSDPNHYLESFNKMKVASLILNLDIDIMSDNDRASVWYKFFNRVSSYEYLKSLEITSIDYNQIFLMKLLDIRSLTVLIVNVVEFNPDEDWNTDFMAILRGIANHPCLEHVSINIDSKFSDENFIDEKLIHELFKNNTVLQKFEFLPFSKTFTIRRFHTKPATKR